MTVKKASIFITILGILGVALLGLKPKSNYQIKTVEIGVQKLTVEVADSPEKRALGLGKRTSLFPGKGMLFIFPTSSRQQIWMHDMNFPIDIIWIQGDQVVDIASNVPPPIKGELQLAVYTPKEKADQVLEVKANFTRENSVKIGDQIRVAP